MSDTFTDTYNRQDIRRVHASFSADYQIVAEWTELHSARFISQTIEQIQALAEAEYLQEIHLQLKSRAGAIREASVYRVSTNASSWSKDRPGDLYWDSFDGDSLVLIVYFSQKWYELTSKQREDFAKVHMSSWTTSDFDGTYGSLTQNIDRHYSSRAYGLERTRYSK
jgi:hypothetical protein